ncbi:MAG TPA: BREX-2 system phosphatase PglZ [Pirellulales bacterium]|nr:BREX-2 system phosphatase PglZ [Pirellulales bacterium]
MTTAAPTFSQIKAQVAAIRHKVNDARTIGIRSAGRWTGETTKRDGNQTYHIFQCDSPLAMRLALREPDDGTTKVIITGLEANALGDDILLRLTKRKLYTIDSWEIVRSLFQARSIDARLTEHTWMADWLLELFPPRDCPPARGGFLDAEIVWPLLLNRVIGLTGDHPDVTGLLKWSIDLGAVERFRQAPEKFRRAAADWLADRAGATVRTILQCVEHSGRPDAVPLGLAAGVIYHPAAAGRLERAAGKFEERHLDGQTPKPTVVERWSAAASEVVRLQLTDSKLKRQQLERSDEILAEVQAKEFAYLSHVSPLGFNQRLARLGNRLVEMAAHHAFDASDELREAHQAVREHELARHEARRLERIDMALRLTRWLAERRAKGDRAPRSLAEAAGEHWREGGFVDWARLSLLGDPVQELSQAYARVFDEVTRNREEQARMFGLLLRDWTAAGPGGDDVVPVERIIERIVSPLAANYRVLVIVIDGMSVAVCRELLADVTRHEWSAICESAAAANRCGIATIPSVTEYSRTSLLCGRLQRGTAADERAAFAAHPALLPHCRAGYGPILFHKASLQESADAVLAAEVRDAIASPERRVVGVVINAVDDHLLKGDQLDIRWTRDEIRVLPSLLHEAASARRIVIFLSDHGHVVDHQTDGEPHEGGERWRPDDGRPTARELQIAGSRVGVENHRLIAPWTEKLRYAVKKNGYHGGLNPQEMVVPIVILSRVNEIPEGWTEMPIDTPGWWDEPSTVAPPAESSEPQVEVARRRPETLFDLVTEEPAVGETSPARVATPEAAAPPWIGKLLASAVFENQRRLGGRAVPANDIFARLLALLDQRGGKLTAAALARGLDYPPMSLRGLLAVIQRVLNVDGYAVLNRDENSDTIELNRELLLRQFDLV